MSGSSEDKIVGGHRATRLAEADRTAGEDEGDVGVGEQRAAGAEGEAEVRRPRRVAVDVDADFAPAAVCAPSQPADAGPQHIEVVGMAASGVGGRKRRRQRRRRRSRRRG